ncbi:MAG: DUF4386 domain-containing protein [Deltaproteobacteria bacterium]|nr:DUF4386 domain-containing protein [Deltaproteobacteria bacterium]
MNTPRIFGIFFILTFLSYGIGSGLSASIASGPEGLLHVAHQSTELVVGVVLMAFFHSVLNIAMPLLLLPFLKDFGERRYFAYLAAAISATITLVVGAIFLLMLLPLSEVYQNATISEQASLNTLSVVLQKGAFYAYQLGMAFWGIGGLFLCNLLCKSAVVPRFFAIWGSIGYVVFISGTLLELFGVPYGVMMSAPGGLFEIFLAFWAIVKGFKTDNA